MFTLLKSKYLILYIKRVEVPLIYGRDDLMMVMCVLLEAGWRCVGEVSEDDKK